MSFTPGQISAFVIALFGLILTILNIKDKHDNFKDRESKPLKELSERVEELEHWQRLADMRFEAGSKHFDKLDEGFKVVQQSLLALMDDALSENGKHEELQRARDQLFSYLSGK